MRIIQTITGTTAIVCLALTMACNGSNSKEDPPPILNIVFSADSYRNNQLFALGHAYILSNETIKHITSDDNPTWEFPATLNGAPTNVPLLFVSYSNNMWQWETPSPVAPGQYSIRATVTVGSQKATSDPSIFTVQAPSPTSQDDIEALGGMVEIGHD
jgi:hypothetical protein